MKNKLLSSASQLPRYKIKKPLPLTVITATKNPVH